MKFLKKNLYCWARILLLSPALFGCATGAVQSREMFENPPAVVKQKEIANVPFVEQAEAECGPATLAMVLQYEQKNVSVKELLPQVYSPNYKGSLQQDMITAARRHGMLAIPIRGYSALLQEIEANHPVIIFENLGLSWYPQWHYAVAFGYDLPNRTLTLHSGPDARKIEDMRLVEASWKLGDYWGLLVLPPDTLSKTATELNHIAAAAGLESLGDAKSAEIAYTKILQRWPKSLGARIGLGNIYFQEKNYKKSEKILKKAVALYPESHAAQQNLAFVREKLKKP